MKVLIICFSNISNVAAMVPLVDSLNRIHPEKEFFVLSRRFLRPLFASFEHVTFCGADIRYRHKGLHGAIKLFLQLRREKFDVVIDLQKNWRSKFIWWLFRLSGVKTIAIDEQKIESRRLVKKGAIHYRQLQTVFEKYAETFQRVHLVTDNKFVALPPASEFERNKIEQLYGKKSGTWIGFAPFSKSRGKTLPLRKTKNIIQYFDEREDTKIFLFGIGEMENELLSDWQTVYKNVFAVHTALKLSEELALMEQLDVMISMDSANMHLAALTNTPVVSVWGETHPYAGFLGWNQPYSNCVGVSFSCRPCGERHNHKCRYGDYRCLESIPSARIIEKVNKIIEKFS